ncbi:hypothetical protein ACHQM5_006382 [Ranunculus cassubicifolius]
MKFGKEFASQMVPEWKETYMDYNMLKSALRDIQEFKGKSRGATSNPNELKRKMTLYRAFSGLTEYEYDSYKGVGDVEDQVILVKEMQNESDYETCGYKTTFLGSSEQGGEYELVYFRRLDDEFNKVVNFYKKMVDDVMNEATSLNKQMDALIAFRVKVENPEANINWSDEMTQLNEVKVLKSSSDDARSPKKFKDGRVAMQTIHENDQQKEEWSEEPSDNTISSPYKRKIEGGLRPAPLEVLNHVKFNTAIESPVSTIKSIFNINNSGELNFEKENLIRVEGKLQLVFIEFYQKLRLLKSYSFLNILAFSKIMKKYDKITARHASKSYLKMVDNSYLGSSDEVNKLIERVEATFIKHFANGNRSNGINILRPKPKRERHRVTFLLGFFSGCTIALLVSLVLLISTLQILKNAGRTQYMETVFPHYTFFGYIVLHMVMFAGDIYYWRLYRVNYPFIFGFKQGTELGYREVLLFSAALATLALATVLANLDMEIDLETGGYEVFKELLPLILLIFVCGIIFCPFNIMYRTARFYILTCLFHCICAPLYKVTLQDFFFADQLTSQVQAIRSIEYYICYYGWGDYTRRQHKCNDLDVYKIFQYIVASIPYLWRFLQCLRRLFEEKDPMQGYNAFKYFSAILAVSIRTTYSRHDTTMWLVLAWTFSILSAMLGTYWDIVVDWGLLQRNSRNRWLRDKLLVPNKYVYFGAMVLNVLLRLAWLQTVMKFRVSFLHKEALIAIIASLEIIRRGIWNFFRLENEHLNNVGKFRAFKSIPLPFNYNENDDKED